jgi:plasmid stabilization system protein ParE
MPRVLFTDAARADLAEAVDWYDAHAAHVVPLFRESLRAAVARIGANPKQFPPGRIRPAGLCFRAFPTS